MGARGQWFLYVSRVSEGLSRKQVDEIVQASQVRNRRHRLTGARLFTGAHFAQVLEGEKVQLEPVV